MKIFRSNIVLLACTMGSVLAGDLIDSLSVAYKRSITLGEAASIAVASPKNSIFSLRGVLHAPNGTSQLTFGTYNFYYYGTPFNATTSGVIDPASNETCSYRASSGQAEGFEAWGSNRPDRASDGWGHSITIDLYYSHDYSYTYQTRNESGHVGDYVCITPPYITERRTTELHNFTVGAAANGATTTTFTPTPIVQPNLFPQDVGAATKWALSPAGTGQTYEPTSGAERLLAGYWSLFVPLVLVVASL